jgi:CRP-like cAMP-binding protein
MDPLLIESYLSEHPVFRFLDSRHIARLAKLASPVTFQPSEFVFRQGEAADRVYLLLDGSVSVETPSPVGGPITIETLGDGDILGWSWFFPPYQWHFDARAKQLCRAVAIDGRALREQCEQDHDLGFELMKRFALVVVERLQAAQVQLLDLYGSPR